MCCMYFEVFESSFIPWVLPVDVKTVELVLSQELERVVDERVHAEYVFGQLFEGL